MAHRERDSETTKEGKMATPQPPGPFPDDEWDRRAAEERDEDVPLDVVPPPMVPPPAGAPRPAGRSTARPLLLLLFGVLVIAGVIALVVTLTGPP